MLLYVIILMRTSDAVCKFSCVVYLANPLLPDNMLVENEIDFPDVGRPSEGEALSFGCQEEKS